MDKEFSLLYQRLNFNTGQTQVIENWSSSETADERGWKYCSSNSASIFCSDIFLRLPAYPVISLHLADLNMFKTFV